MVYNTNKLSKDWIEVMAYSPDGKYLAVGTHSRDILFLEVENNY
jgi:tricorn protease-like protein